MEKIKELREKSRKLLLQNETLNIYKAENEEFFQDDINEANVFGLEDEYIKFLRLKI
jgi:hypothetical protein